ncbi:MAG: restriction endonuclease subunit S [Terriglobales bacterium]
MPTVSELFDVRYGQSLELNRLTKTDSDSGIAFVSRKMKDNGVSAFVLPIDGLPPGEAGELTVALGGNGVLSTFLQERPFYTGRDVAILKSKEKLSKPVLLFYCMCIKANRYRYSYGRQANRTLKDLVVPPLANVPAWASEADLDRFIGAEKPFSSVAVPLTSTSSWSECVLGDLFDIRKGKRLTKAQMTPGSTIFIGAIDNNNGVRDFIGQLPIHEGNTITVNYNGNGVAEAFYQPEPFWCSDDVNVLYPKFTLTPAIALFIATVIRLERYRFNYGRKWHLDRMRSAVIKLPALSTGEPDWVYMRRFIESLPFSSQLSR